MDRHETLKKPDGPWAHGPNNICSGCGRPRDEKRRCWKCCDRWCEDCGVRLTGSAFIALCAICAHTATVWDEVLG